LSTFAKVVSEKTKWLFLCRLMWLSGAVVGEIEQLGLTSSWFTFR